MKGRDGHWPPCDSWSIKTVTHCSFLYYCHLSVSCLDISKCDLSLAFRRRRHLSESHISQNQQLWQRVARRCNDSFRLLQHDLFIIISIKEEEPQIGVIFKSFFIISHFEVSPRSAASVICGLLRFKLTCFKRPHELNLLADRREFVLLYFHRGVLKNAPDWAWKHLSSWSLECVRGGSFRPKVVLQVSRRVVLNQRRRRRAFTPLRASALFLPLSTAPPVI